PRRRRAQNEAALRGFQDVARVHLGRARGADQPQGQEPRGHGLDRQGRSDFMLRRGHAVAAGLILALSPAAPAGAKELPRLPPPDGLVLVFRASPVSNLVYHLNCLAGVGSCTAKAYRDFWNARSWSADDEKTIARWGALMKKYEKEVSLDDSSR